MDGERWRRIESLFDAAGGLSPSERPTMLERECEDEELRREVEELLRARDEADDFILRPAFESCLGRGGETGAGARIGSYEIVRQIGRGGMGTVYLAARADDEYRTHVAIKLVAAGLRSQEIVRRFRNERQILASLDHPNIARLLDGGTTAGGMPYFVMEYVDGRSLVDYCDRKRLSIPERLRLFQKVCAAVQHAHQNLVVHRDLKPSNILVTNEGEPKLLDFGIAKLLDPTGSSGGPDETATSARAMTPDFASPEQVRGEPITTASDIYSLGVVLYRLLTGRHPYRISTATPREIERVVCETVSEKPSDAVVESDASADDDTTRLSASEASVARAATPERLRRILRGDLDNIVLMAMRKEPARRYATAAELSEDLRRYLEGMPVRARRDTVAYRARKFVARHKVGVAAAALAVVALVATSLVAVWEAHPARVQQARAERRFGDVRQLARSLLFEIHDSVQDLAGSTPTRQLLVTRALEYLDSLARESQDDPELRRELATAYEKVGDIQGNPYVANLGDTEGALASYEKALAIREELEIPGEEAALRRELAITYRSIGDVLEQKGDVAACLDNYRRSLATLEALAADYPADDGVRDELARAYETLGDGLGRTRERAEQLDCYRKTLAIRDEALARDPANAKLRRSVAIALMKVGEGWVDDEATGIRNFQRSIEILESLAAADPTSARARRELSMVENRLGEVLIATGDYGAAIETLDRARAIREAIAAADPANAQARFDVATALANESEALARAGRAKEGEGLARRALEAFEALATADPENMVYLRNLALSYEKVGIACEALASRGPQHAAEWREASGAYTRARDLFVDLERRGALRPADEAKASELDASVRRCDAALAAR
jgi:serine/threonine protein kinase